MRNIPRHPILTAVICFSKKALFTIKRSSDPYREFYSLPESFVKRSETLEQSAHRTLFEASGLNATKLKLISVFDDVATGERRVPNVRSCIISFLALNWTGEPPLENCRWVSDWQGTQLAFEHNIMALEAEEVIGMASKSRLLYAVR